MACGAEFQEWTVDLVFDNPNTANERLVFCMRFTPHPTIPNEQTIDGRVFKVDGTDVSALSGRTRPFRHANPNPAGGGATLMSLEFTMDGVNVAIAGVKLPTRFEGRLRAFAAAGFAAAAPSGGVRTAIPLAPSDGDTGTASGTQT